MILIVRPRPGRVLQVRMHDVAAKRRAIVKRKIRTAANMVAAGVSMPEIKRALGVR